MRETHQLHVDMKESTFRELQRILPEQKMVSLLVRKLVADYIMRVKNGENPWCFLEARKENINGA